jgi:hypothetical protein
MMMSLCHLYTLTFVLILLHWCYLLVKRQTKSSAWQYPLSPLSLFLRQRLEEQLLLIHDVAKTLRISQNGSELQEFFDHTRCITVWYTYSYH